MKYREEKKEGKKKGAGRLEKENGKWLIHVSGRTVIRTSFREHEQKGFEGWPTRYECPLIRAVGYSPSRMCVFTGY